MIAVTGAAGFIGSNIVWELNRRGRGDLVVVDVAADDAGSANLAPLRYERYLEKDAFLRWLGDEAAASGVGTVYHLGACSSTTETDADLPRSATTSPIRAICAVFAWTRGIRFINASSAATYGDGARGYSDDHAARCSNLRPLNLYAKSKQDFDLWALDGGGAGEASSA